MIKNPTKKKILQKNQSLLSLLSDKTQTSPGSNIGGKGRFLPLEDGIFQIEPVESNRPIPRFIFPGLETFSKFASYLHRF